MRLVEDGRLTLETRARTILPTLRIDPAITVRQLLDHTSGLRDFYLNPRIDKALLAKRGQVWNAARSLGYVGKPFARPGTSWHYSNTNYLVLGHARRGRRAGAAGRPAAPTLLRAARARPHLVPVGRGTAGDRSRTATASPARAASCPRSTCRTARRWSRSPRSSPRPAARARSPPRRATSPAGPPRCTAGTSSSDGSRASMIEDIARTARLKPAIPYGLGVQGIPVGGRSALGHSGRFLGSRAVMRWLPAERMAIAVETNQSRTDPALLLADLAGLAFTPPPSCVACSDALRRRIPGSRHPETGTSACPDRYGRVLADRSPRLRLGPRRG